MLNYDIGGSGRGGGVSKGKQKRRKRRGGYSTEIIEIEGSVRWRGWERQTPPQLYFYARQRQSGSAGGETKKVFVNRQGVGEIENLYIVRKNKGGVSCYNKIKCQLKIFKHCYNTHLFFAHAGPQQPLMCSRFQYYVSLCYLVDCSVFYQNPRHLSHKLLVHQHSGSRTVGLWINICRRHNLKIIA